MSRVTLRPIAIRIGGDRDATSTPTGVDDDAVEAAAVVVPSQGPSPGARAEVPTEFPSGDREVFCSGRDRWRRASHPRCR